MASGAFGVWGRGTRREAMTIPIRPALESSAALRDLIHRKRAQGQLTKALILARLASQAAKLERVSAVRDGISRVALERYLELMPEDRDAQHVLQSLASLAPMEPIEPLGSLPTLSHFVPLRCPKPVTPTLPKRVWRLLAWLLMAVPLTPAMPIVPTLSIAPPPIAIAALKVEDGTTPIVIRAVGDVVLGSDYPEHRLPTQSDQQRIAALRQELRHADVVVGNLEGVLSDAGISRKDVSKPGYFSFRMPTAYAATLREMGFDVMSLANNHAMDFGLQGLESSISALKANGIAPMGVPGAEVATIKIRNTTVAFLNYSYLNAFTRMDEANRIQTQIQQARAQANWVVVSVHGGKEGEAAIGTPDGDEYYMNEYRGDLVKFAHLAIDAGASAVFGHGPHVVRPYELYQGKPIFYSLGNFVGYRSLSTQGKLAHSIVAEVRFSPQGQLLGAGIIPLKLDRSGIPVVDYSNDNLQSLSDLLLEKLDKRPVLGLATQPAKGMP